MFFITLLPHDSFAQEQQSSTLPKSTIKEGIELSGCK